MNALTRNWLLSTLAGWVCLIYGWCVGDRWAIGLALFLFLVLSVERWDNYQRGRRSGGAR